MCAFGNLLEREFFAAIEWLQVTVLQCGEEQLLVGIEIEGLGEHPELHRLEVGGAFRDDHDVGPGLSALGLAQPSGRQQLVVDDEPVVVYEQDIDAGLHVAVLVGIVEQDDIGVLGGFIGGQALNAVAALFVDRHIDAGEFLQNLVRLIADITGCALLVGQHVATAFPLVAPAQYRHFHLVVKLADEVFHMRCLAGAPHRDVAHRNDGNVERLAFQDAEFEHLVTDAYADSVEPAKRGEPFVDLDEVAFHFLMKLLFDVRLKGDACLDGILLADGAQLHEGCVEFTQCQAEFAVEIAAALARGLIE